jgi:hypothetical protein
MDVSLDAEAENLSTFSRSRFIHDFITLSKSMNAPYSQTTIENILIAFNEHWENSAILFRCTDRPGGVVNFRFFARRRVDMIAIAAHASLIKLEDPLAQMITSWSSLGQGDSQQWCDFDPRNGLAKTWVYSAMSNLSMRFCPCQKCQHQSGNMHLYFTVWVWKK